VARKTSDKRERLPIRERGANIPIHYEQNLIGNLKQSVAG
jgi:hypothetical protein